MGSKALTVVVVCAMVAVALYVWVMDAGAQEKPVAWPDAVAATEWIDDHPESMAKLVVDVCDQNQVAALWAGMFPPQDADAVGTALHEAREALRRAGAADGSPAVAWVDAAISSAKAIASREGGADGLR